MPTDRAGALLADILASPNDDAPRRAYADWLVEHGDPARAELITVQCALARGVTDAGKAAALAEREAMLLDEHGEKWSAFLKPYADHVSSFAWRRGFIEEIWLSNLADVDAIGRLFCATPISSLSLHAKLGDVDAAKALVALPQLSSLRALSIYKVFEPIPAVTATILRSGRLVALESLHLEVGPVTAVQATQLLEELERLRRLALVDERMPIETVEAIADSVRARALRALTIQASGWTQPKGNRAATVIAESPNLRELQELDLAGCSVGDVGAIAIAGGLDKLTSLELVDGHITNKGARAIATSPGLASLRYLRLRRNKISNAGARALAESPTLRGLEYFDMTCNLLDAKGEAALTQAFGDRVTYGWT